MIDCNFPIIEIDPNDKDFTHSKSGLVHGESHREAIKELVEIRTELMLAKNPSLSSVIPELALQQLEVSRNFAPHIIEELEGIAQGSNCTKEEIVILNNYTDFRDISLPEQGCSTICMKHPSQEALWSGQTWDMHGSAKNYLCLIKIKATKDTPARALFSLVGCMGMMGISSRNLLVGVNNINTLKAKAGLIWPVLIRKCTEAKDIMELRNILLNAPVTSGHNYIISSPDIGEHWEITPTTQEMVGEINKENSFAFHTNHCMGEKAIAIEDQTSQSSTTHNRFSLLERLLPKTSNYQQFVENFKSHEEFPKSICSHYESGAQDPSYTCGGGSVDFNSGEMSFWRGCQEKDANFVQYDFKINGDSIEST